MYDFDNDDKDKNKDYITQLIDEQISIQKSRLESRKIIQRILMEISCQIFSAGLAKFMFQFAVDFNFTCGLCIVIASIPSLPTLRNLEFHKTENGITIYSMKKPILLIFMFGIRTLIVSSTLYSLSTQIGDTARNIDYMYKQIEEYERPQVQDFLPPYAIQILGISAAIVCLGMFLNSLRKRSPFD